MAAADVLPSFLVRVPVLVQRGVSVFVLTTYVYVKRSVSSCEDMFLCSVIICVYLCLYSV